MKKWFLLLFLTTLLQASDIAVVTFVKGDSDPTALDNKRKYCAHHDYNFFAVERTDDQKVATILKALDDSKYQWIFVVEADSLIMNGAVRIEEIIDDNYDFILCEEGKALCTSTFLIRNSNASKNFLRSISSQKEIAATLEKKKEYKSLTKVVAQRFFNACAPGTGGGSITAEYQKGDFLINFANVRPRSEEFAKKYAQEVMYDPNAVTLDHHFGIYGWVLTPQASKVNEAYVTEAQTKQFSTILASYPKIREVVEIGFNGGHSADFFLKNCIGLDHFVTFEIDQYYYTPLAIQFLQKRYRNKFRFVDGDSKKTVPQYLTHYGGQKVDLIYIDGDKSFEGRLKDIINCEGLANGDTYVWINECDDPATHEAITMAQKTGLLRVIALHRSHDECYGDRAWAECKYNF